MAENIWLCALYGKVNRFQELAPAGVPVKGSEVTVNGLLIIELLFGDPYAAFAERALRPGRFVLSLERHDAVSVPTLDAAAQSFLNTAYGIVVGQGETPKDPPDFYGILAPAAKSSAGWPVYFFAVGMGLNLPAEAYRGKVALPSRSRPNQASTSARFRLPWGRR
jgi:hypothetical protein